MKYSLGQKIYYTGDQANQSGMFEIVFATNDNHGQAYNLRELNGDRMFRNVFHCGIGDVYEGHCGTRFVTEEAYNNYHKEA